MMVRPRGIEPPHPAPEAGALSTELRAHMVLYDYSKIAGSSQKKLLLCLCQDLVGGTPGLRKIIFILSREGSNLGDFP